MPPTSAAGGLPPPEQASQAAAFGADQPHPSPEEGVHRAFEVYTLFLYDVVVQMQPL